MCHLYNLYCILSVVPKLSENTESLCKMIEGLTKRLELLIPNFNETNIQSSSNDSTNETLTNITNVKKDTDNHYVVKDPERITEYLLIDPLSINESTVVDQGSESKINEPLINNECTKATANQDCTIFGGVAVTKNKLEDCNHSKPSKLVADLMTILFTPDEMANSSVTGKVSNIHKNRQKDNEVREKEVLCSLRRKAIEGTRKYGFSVIFMIQLLLLTIHFIFQNMFSSGFRI